MFVRKRDIEILMSNLESNLKYFRKKNPKISRREKNVPPLNHTCARNKNLIFFEKINFLSDNIF